MNDEFLYRLRDPPPAAFAARLRARLESLVVVRRFRRRQITLYSLIACLLGSAAFALVVPTVRERAQALLLEVWSQGSPQPALRASQPALGMGPAAQLRRAASSAPAPSTTSSEPQRVQTTAAVTKAVTSASSVTSGSNAAAIGGFGPTPSSERRFVRQLVIGGVDATNAAIRGPIRKLSDLRPDLAVTYEYASNERAFSKLCSNEIEVALTTRLPSPSELDSCRKSRFEISAVPLAYEALVVVVNPANDWAETLRFTDLEQLFPASSAANGLLWNQLDSRWPSITVESFVPRAGSDFADTFNELVFNAASRQRLIDSTGTAEEAGRSLQRSFSAITYMPYSLYLELEQKYQPAPKLLKIVNTMGVTVMPSRTTIEDGSYPLARPLLLFTKRYRSRAVEELIELALSKADRRLARSAYLPLQPQDSELALSILSTPQLLDFDPRDIRPVTAREILLRQFPEEKRATLRRTLESH